MSRLDEMNHFHRALFARKLFGTIRVKRNSAWMFFLKRIACGLTK